MAACSLEDGLINPEKPWCGTRRFGMSFFDPQSSGLASVGTVLEIQEHQRLPDGRLVVQNIGERRAGKAGKRGSAISRAREAVQPISRAQ